MVHSWGGGPTARAVRVEASGWLVIFAAFAALEFPDAAFCEVSREAITNHGETMAMARSKIIHREKIKWIAACSPLPDMPGSFFCNNVVKILFRSRPPD